MKLLNFSVEGRTSCGVLKDGGIVDAGARLGSAFTSLDSLLAAGALESLRELAAKYPADYALENVRLLKPLLNPGKILCVGINYADHDESQGKEPIARPQYPVLFFRTPNSLVAHGEALIRPPESKLLDYEGEIVLVIGKKGRRVAESDATTHIAGYTICNEGTLRDWQRHTKVNNTPGKNFDRSGAIGPWIVTTDEFAPNIDPNNGDPNNIGPTRVITRVNGETRQDDTTDHMLFPFSMLISYASRFTTLEPGDIIVSGTPPGTGASHNPPRYLVPGDIVEVEVPGIGTLRNPVADEEI